MNNDEQQLRAAMHREREAGQTISGLSTPPWPQPPPAAAFSHSQPEPLLLTRQQLPQGLLRDFVGPRIEAKEVGSVDQYEELDELPAGVTAWPVLPLEGAEFEVDSVAGIAAAMREALKTKLPGVDWWVPEHWEGPFCKYGILHNSLPAPPNLATDEAMAIEIYGIAERAVFPGTDEWMELRRAARARNLDEDEIVAVRLPTRVRIEVATYANVLYPGVRVPEHM